MSRHRLAARPSTAPLYTIESGDAETPSFLAWLRRKSPDADKGAGTPRLRPPVTGVACITILPRTQLKAPPVNDLLSARVSGCTIQKKSPDRGLSARVGRLY
jgi:hypothetical protein